MQHTPPWHSRGTPAHSRAQGNAPQIVLRAPTSEVKVEWMGALRQITEAQAKRYPPPKTIQAKGGTAYVEVSSHGAL